VALVEIAARDDLPDLVFTGRGALICGNLAIVSTFRRPEHWCEQSIYRRALAGAGLATTYLRETYFEGAADALVDPTRPICYAGYGWRTERGATLQLQEIVGWRVLPLMLADERFVHLDMALCPLTSGDVLVYMGAFSPHAQRLLRRTIDPSHLIELNIDDALGFACNAVEVGGNSLVMHRAGRGLRKRLSDIGYRVFCTDLDEFVQAGGSAKSLTLRLDDPSASAKRSLAPPQPAAGSASRPRSNDLSREASSSSRPFGSGSNDHVIASPTIHDAPAIHIGPGNPNFA
jgi:N-dimethylarginine dimethylaminohydrolase